METKRRDDRLDKCLEAKAYIGTRFLPAKYGHVHPLVQIGLSKHHI